MSDMTEQDICAAVNALHRWLQSQQLQINEALCVLMQCAGAELGSAAAEGKYTLQETRKILFHATELLRCQTVTSLLAVGKDLDNE